jgi:hypothetical protein
LVLHFLEFRNFHIGSDRVRNLVIVGSAAESARVAGLLQQAGVPKNLIGTVAPPQAEISDNTYLSDLEQLDEVVHIYRVDEVIFCSRDIRAQDILSWMTRLGPTVSYKIVPEESLSIIGSSNKDEPGELYTIEIRYNIAQPGQRRNKRVLDLLLCIALLLSIPVWLLVSSKKMLFLHNWLPVLIGRKSWVGYADSPQNSSLPTLRPGVCTPADELSSRVASAATVSRLNYLYAKDWSVWRDLEIFLGRR